MDTNSEAAKKRWAKINKEDRSTRMSKAVRARWARMTPEQKKEYGVMMNRARWGKRLSTHENDEDDPFVL